MRASVPSSVVDNTYENFPEGSYIGQIDSAEIRDINNDGSWVTLKVGLDGIVPMDGTNDPGRARFQGELTLCTDGVDVRTVENFSSRDIPFGVVRAAGLLAGLGEALGVAQRTEQGVEVDLEAVVDALANGSFYGEKVAFEVAHYTAKKTGKTYDQFNKFGQAS